MTSVARAIRTVTAVVVALIVLGIVLWVVSANEHNGVVSALHDAAKWFVGPFRNVFTVKGHKLNLALNWGLAAVIYALVGGLLSRLAARPLTGRRGGFGRMRPVA